MPLRRGGAQACGRAAHADTRRLCPRARWRELTRRRRREAPRRRAPARPGSSGGAARSLAPLCARAHPTYRCWPRPQQQRQQQQQLAREPGAQTGQGATHVDEKVDAHLLHLPAHKKHLQRRGGGRGPVQLSQRGCIAPRWVCTQNAPGRQRSHGVRAIQPASHPAVAAAPLALASGLTSGEGSAHSRLRLAPAALVRRWPRQVPSGQMLGTTQNTVSRSRRREMGSWRSSSRRSRPSANHSAIDSPGAGGGEGG